MESYPANLVESTIDNQPRQFTDYEYSQPRSFLVTNNHTKIDNPFGVDAEIALLNYYSIDGGAIFDMTFDIDAPNPSPQLTGPQGMLGFHFSGAFQSGIQLSPMFIPFKDFVSVNISGVTTGIVMYTVIFRRHAIMYLPHEPQRKYFSDPGE